MFVYPARRSIIDSSIQNHPVIKNKVISIENLCQIGIKSTEKLRQLLKTIEAISNKEIFINKQLRVDDLVYEPFAPDAEPIILSTEQAKQLVQSLNSIRDSDVFERNESARKKFMDNVKANSEEFQIRNEIHIWRMPLLIDAKHLIRRIKDDILYVLNENETQQLVECVKSIKDLPAFQGRCVTVTDLILLSNSDEKIHVVTPEEAKGFCEKGYSYMQDVRRNYGVAEFNLTKQFSL